MSRSLMRIVLTWLTAMCLVASSSAEEPILRTYDVEASLMSLIPDAGLTSFKRSGTVTGAPGSHLGVHYRSDARNFDVNIKVATQGGRFLTFVSVKPAKGDVQTSAVEKKIDLTDLKPQSVEIARDADGRVYQLTLIPKAVEHPGPRPFDPAEFRLEQLNFGNSPVILNDREYLGAMGVSGAQVASVEIPGVGDLELSLIRFKGSEPLGQLQGNVITIRHDKDTLTIGNVSNGDRAQILEKGPYLVWVRWETPHQTAEEHRSAFLAELAELKKQAARPDSTLSDDLLERLKHWEAAGAPRFLSCGARRLSPGEILPPKDK